MQVLVIDALTPMPDRDAGSLRLVNLMRLLRDEGAHVIFLAANRQYAGRYTKALQARSEEHTSELQSLMRISYAVFCLQKKIIHFFSSHSPISFSFSLLSQSL